ncbi:diguanylate cyclase domain-containing protein [Jiella endophytica]|nr:diguanylate cyclase [Jiella endophytica]
MAISRATPPARSRLSAIADPIAITAGVAGLQFVAALATGIFIYFMPTENSWDWWVPLWFPSGTAIALVIAFGTRVLPGIWIASLTAEIYFGSALPATIGVPIVNTATPLLVATILKSNRIGLAELFNTVQNAATFLAVTAVVELFFSATLGTVFLLPQDILNGHALFQQIGTWALGNLSADLIVGVPLLIFFALAGSREERPQAKSVGITVLAVLVTCLVFSDLPLGLGYTYMPAGFVVFPLIIWSGLRQRRTETALMVMGIAITATLLTAMGHGPLAASAAPKLNAILLQVFLVSMSLSGLLLSTANAERLASRNEVERTLTALDLLIEDRTIELNRTNRRLKSELAEGQRRSTIMRGQAKVMEMLTSGEDLSPVLTTLLAEFRRTQPDCEAAILVKDEAGAWEVAAIDGDPAVFDLFARRLPPEGAERIDGRKGGETAVALLRKRLDHAFVVMPREEEARLAGLIAEPIAMHDVGREGLFCIRETAAGPCDREFLADMVRLAGVVLSHKSSIDSLHHVASHDALTGVFNRYGLFQHLGALVSAPAGPAPFRAAILFIDLDGFKAVNDALGHELGDRLLVEFAHRIRDVVGPEAIVCRLGGDEFVVALLDVAAPALARAAAGRLIDGCQGLRCLSGTELAISPSIGVTLWDGRSASLNTVIDQADGAMYAAKRSGGGRVMFHQDQVAETG